MYFSFLIQEVSVALSWNLISNGLLYEFIVRIEGQRFLKIQISPNRIVNRKI